MPQLRIYWPGVHFAFLSAFLFGASVPLSKLLLGAINPWLLAGLLYVGSGTGLLLFVFIRRFIGRAASEASVQRKSIPWLLGTVFFGGVLGPVFLMAGLSYTPASSASLLLNLESLATMVIAWVIFRENVDKRVFIGAMVIVAGAVVLSWRGGSVVHWGSLGIAAACLCWGIDNNLTRKISGVDPVMTAGIKGLVAGPVNVALALLIGAQIPHILFVAAAAGLGLVTYGISLVFLS